MNATAGPDGLCLPIELHQALGSPTRLSVTPPDDEGGISIRPDSTRARTIRLARRVLRTRVYTHGAVLASRNGSGVVFRTAAPIPAGSHGIANYGTFFYLIHIDGTAERENREASWAAIEDYHEHRELERQDATAHQTSRWLAENVLLPLAANGSILEVGCGAGRNLKALRDTDPGVSLSGLDISPAAIANAKHHVPSADLKVGSLYDLSQHADSSFDVVFTSGVLMHVPHDEVEATIREMHRLARRAVVHFELHGPSHSFDFHRYPRDYGQLYERMEVPADVSYETFPPPDFRSTGIALPFSHSLLVAKKPA
jgi:SAM-dependent methyltransferase